MTDLKYQSSEWVEIQKEMNEDENSKSIMDEFEKKMKLNFNYSNELTNKVKNNWLTLENKSLFVNCKTNNDFCLTFVKLSNKKELELSLSGKITDVLLRDIFNNQKNYI